VHYSDATSRGSEVRPEAWPGHADADGNETVETWDCTPDCPVRLLDEQSGGASRFFYCAKASKKEREAGLAQREPKKVNDGRDTPIDNAYQRGETARCNVHPTVKPLDLCRYLATLILPPPRLGETRKLLTPFSGSGSEMIAAQQAGWDETWGIEQSPEYVEIAAARLRHWLAGGKD
jgi:site-specific DNA-methyltransferase (adenine-specific)